MWGTYPNSLGYYADKVDDPITTPQKVESFDGNVVKVVCGLSHTAVITSKKKRDNCLSDKMKENYILSVKVPMEY